METPEPPSVAELTRIFRELGARDPESWARSQAEERINQLARFLFLKQAWGDVVREDDPTWIANRIAESERHPNAPYSGVGPALRRMAERGVDPRDITDVVRGMQAELLGSLCYLLSDSASGRVDLPQGCPGVTWGLYELDDNCEPVRPISGLHESVLNLDPTRREMCPREAR